jgi:4-amino-4-deoxychorismate lyase
MAESNPGFWYNGNLETGDRIPISITDPALLYGATHFTTLRIYHQTLTDPRTHWPHHLQRLRQTLPHFIEPNWAQLIEGATYLSKYYEILRLTLFPDGRHLITGRSLPPDLYDRQTHGISALLLSPDQTRSLPHLKTGNYLAPWLALQDAHLQNCAEAIFTDRNGNWLETTTGNLWGYAKGIWHTPPLYNSENSTTILPGIQRSALITVLQSQNIAIQEITWSPDRIAQFECIAYSNSVIELIPIHTIISSENIKLYEFSANFNPIKRLQNLLFNS